jgi:DNA mismatch endonuclease (patch repair protein)
MKDPLTKKQRSALMARIKGHDNLSTEIRVVQELRAEKIVGWHRRNRKLLGSPDFVFSHEQVVIFVDGCFWHGCPRCGRLPKSRTKFWHTKITTNRARDKRVSRELRQQGYGVIRIWEHQLSSRNWLTRLRSMLEKRRNQSVMHGKSNIK